MGKSKNRSKKSKPSTSSTAVTPIGTLSRKTDRTELSENTWVVFRGPSGERKPMMFSGRLSRDKVRSAYAKITGTSHDRTRSRRLKNY
jgi:hypothetical protein